MWQHTPVSIRGWLLLACGGFGATYLVGEFFGSPLLPSAELFAWGSLAACLVVAGDEAPGRVRLALGAGVVILGSLAALPLLSTVDGNASGLSYAWTAAPRRTTLDAVTDAVRTAAPVLVGYVCLALATLFLPGRRTRAGTAVAVAGAGIAVTYAGLVIWSHDAEPAFVLAALPPLIVAVLAFLVAGRVSRRLSTAGLVLLGLATLVLLSDVLDHVWVFPSGDAFLQPGMSTYYTEAVLLPASAPFFATWSVAPALKLAAAATITAGCLHQAPSPTPPPDTR